MCVDILYPLLGWVFDGQWLVCSALVRQKKTHQFYTQHCASIHYELAVIIVAQSNKIKMKFYNCLQQLFAVTAEERSTTRAVTATYAHTVATSTSTSAVAIKKPFNIIEMFSRGGGSGAGADLMCSVTLCTFLMLQTRPVKILIFKM